MKKISLFVLIVSISVFVFVNANEALKQNIIAFEQAITLRDVYDSFKTRQHSWHQDIMNASLPKELGKLLVELQGFIIKEKLGNSLNNITDAWIDKAINANTYDEIEASLRQLQNYYFSGGIQDDRAIKKDIIAFGQHVPSKVVKEGFEA
ncbi:MAG: hypothetical protein ACUVRK_11110 [Spirochaetota bacterium]